jgi:hypothetical protein
MLVLYQIQPTHVVPGPNPLQNTSQQPLCFALTRMQHLSMHHGAIAPSSESSTSLHKTHDVTSLLPFTNVPSLSLILTKPTRQQSNIYATITSARKTKDLSSVPITTTVSQPMCLTAMLIVYKDNTGALEIANSDLQYCPCTKHISIKWHCFCDHIASGEITVAKIDTTLQWADFLTSPFHKFLSNACESLSWAGDLLDPPGLPPSDTFACWPRYMCSHPLFEHEGDLSPCMTVNAPPS